MMLGILIKSSVFLYGGLKGMEYVFRIPYRYFAMPVACITTMFSIFISTDFSDHIVEGLNVDFFLVHVPLELMVPILITFVLLIKNGKNKGMKKGVKNMNYFKKLMSINSKKKYPLKSFRPKRKK
ncbi:hypothetical protein AAHH67_28340 [Niallia circulans]